MHKLLIYLSKSFLLIWMIVLFAFLVLIGLLDTLANSGDIMAESGKFSDTFLYMYYRLPVIFERIFVFTLIVTILLLYVRLIRQHELVAMLSFGISVPKQILLLSPIVITATLFAIIVIDLSMPPAVRALQNWGIGEYKTKNITPENPLWLEDTNRIVKASHHDYHNQLRDVEFFVRGNQGNIQSILWASKAVYQQGEWQLKDVRELEITGAEGAKRQASPLTEYIWKTQQTPASIARLTAEPRDLSLKDMHDIQRKGISGSQPGYTYKFWAAHRLSRTIATLALLICLVPIMQRTERHSTGDKALVAGILLGFIFLIIDGAIATFCTSGGISPFWAINLPLIGLGLTGLYLCIRCESLNNTSQN